jgi:uncharacterized protein YcbX
MGLAVVTALHVFPVKSLRGTEQPTAMVQPCGLLGDRRWMVTDGAGRFMTQREHPRMALVQAALNGDTLRLSRQDAPGLTVSGEDAGSPCHVEVWRDGVAARDGGDAAASWLTEALGVPCRLVHLADAQARKLQPDFARHPGEAVSFADGFPLLLASASSLAEVNLRLDRQVPMLRFRPNVVIEGAPAWQEDRWRVIRIGQAVFRVAKPCDRCIMTTIDPQTGLRPDGNEPLRTLSKFRRDRTGRVMFGQNLVPEQCGGIAVGDAVEVLESGEPNVDIIS